METFGIDLGLSRLIATSEGALFGRGLIDNLRRIDWQLVGIRRHRSCAGDNPRNCFHYRLIIDRLRGML